MREKNIYINKILVKFINIVTRRKVTKCKCSFQFRCIPVCRARPANHNDVGCFRP